MAVCYVNSPLGILRLSGTDAALYEVTVADKWGEEEAPEQLALARQELAEYFEGRRQSFTVVTKPRGTEFQQAVWRILQTIAYGQSMTYGEIAEALGRPGAARAVGNAVGANPCLILIPCHRVLAKAGPGGFSCGLWRKQVLLTLEGITIPEAGEEHGRRFIHAR